MSSDSTESATTSAAGISPDEKPRRNLTKAFEALCVVLHEGTEKEVEAGNDFAITQCQDKISTSVISPTSVATCELQELQIPTTDSITASDCTNSSSDSFVSKVLEKLPKLHLHPDLSRDLSMGCVTRVSCYSVIHDINKEASAMASHDPAAMSNPDSEKSCPLVVAASGMSLKVSKCDPSLVQQALIDEEKWLLSCIEEQKDSGNASAQCPATFLQAIGEQEYENPVHAVTGHARTQLWKPCRSWWEAKSGKNPWIEPASHNKRWRYLWPLIHYHKFLARCIKKLKRNGVDVKQTVSPVSIFLREEVCAVSDHLASVSLFGSESWMECLEHFEGWTIVGAVEQYRAFIRTLPLQPLQEPGDVESPVLRSQIDEAFLLSMQRDRDALTASSYGTNGISKHHEASTQAAVSHGPPPIHPSRSPAAVPRQINGVRRPRYYPHGWYGWDPTSYGAGPPPYHDNSSVQSELSGNSYPKVHFEPGSHYHHSLPPPMYPHPLYGYPHQYPMYPPMSSDHSDSTGDYTGHHHEYVANGSWVDPSTAYAMQQQYYPFPPGPQPYSINPVTNPSEEEQHCTPFKYDPQGNNNDLTSPYWSHLDQATISMGLATPGTPRRQTPKTLTENENEDEDEESNIPVAPLIRQPYSDYNHSSPIPPSPATQFMMSPQASFAYNYGYGFSPRRWSGRNTTKQPHHSVSATPTSTPLKLLVEAARKSPNTVETVSESLDQPTVQ